MTERFIAFKKDGVIDRKIGFVHESCFTPVSFKMTSDEGEEIECYRAPTDSEAISQFQREGYETVVLSKEEVDFENKKEFLIDKKNRLINNRQELLKATDWYVIRELETGELCPEDITIARTQARLDIKFISASTNTDELNNLE